MTARPLTYRQRLTLHRLARTAHGDHEPRVVGWQRRGPVVQTSTGHVWVDRQGNTHDLDFDQLAGVGA